MGRPLIDLKGSRFGKLTVVVFVPKSIHKKDHAHWLCKCDCGNYKVADSDGLRKFRIRSCGCLYANRSGESHTRIYKTWNDMCLRCSNPKISRYSRYGGRGIKVCDEWKDFFVFKEWAMSNGYKDNLTIDRENGNGNYEPGNCRWLTKTENNKNKCKR